MKKLILALSILGIAILASSYCIPAEQPKVEKTDTYRLIFKSFDDGDKSNMRYVYCISDTCKSCDMSYYNKYNKIETYGAVNIPVSGLYYKEIIYTFPQSVHVAINVTNMQMVDNVSEQIDAGDKLYFMLYKNDKLIINYTNSNISINEIIQ